MRRGYNSLGGSECGKNDGKTMEIVLLCKILKIVFFFFQIFKSCNKKTFVADNQL